MSFPSFTKIYHNNTYPALNPTQPGLSAKGKTIVITGGGTGIGAETAKFFAKAGAAKIFLLGRREQPLLDTKAAINKESPSVEVDTASTDVTSQSSVEAAFAKLLGNGKVDVLISNAGMIGPLKPVATADVDEWFKGVSDNLRSAFIVAQTFLRYAAADPVIVNVSSCAAHWDTMPNISSYNASKWVVVRYFQSLAFENPHLSVFHIQPGFVFTDMAREAGAKEGVDDPALPASFMVWLVSPEARFLKGKFLWANWDVDELKARAKEIEEKGLLELGLVGWPFGMGDVAKQLSAGLAAQFMSE